MGTRADEDKFELSLILRVDEKPVRPDVAFAVPPLVPSKRMVAVTERKGDVGGKQAHN